MDEWNYPNFTKDEMRCKGSGKLIVHPGFMEALQELRDKYGKPMIVTSGCRSWLHNQAVGGTPRSFHICDDMRHPGQKGTLAVDIRINNAAEAWRLAFLAMQMGWSVGVPKSGFLHLDRRDFVGFEPMVFGY